MGTRTRAFSKTKKKKKRRKECRTGFMVSAILVGVMRFLTLVALFLLESPGQIEPLAKLSYKETFN